MRERIKEYEPSTTVLRKRPKYLAILLGILTDDFTSRTDISGFILKYEYKDAFLKDITSEEARFRLDQVGLVIRCLYLHNRISERFFQSVCELTQ